MTDRPEASPWLKLLGSVFVSATLALSPQVFAQEESDDDAVEEEEVTDEVVVTGSRLKRDTYTSVAPLQIISGQISREVGLMDAGQILQESTSAAGQQIDLTFGGFVLDDGPGQTNINLRGLGGARTLVLINGRRVAPGGVEGAPSTPDLGLIPSSLIQQIDVLLDGASSVYGSDAVAGVANVIMRKDFDGLELEAFTSVPQYDDGVQNTLRATWGMNFDRGFIGIGAEYTDQESVTLDQRPWTEGCSRNIEIDEDGNIRSQNVWREVLNAMPWDSCTAGVDFFTNFGSANPGLDSSFFSESLFYTPGTSNVGIPNWSDWSEFISVIDLDQDGENDVNFRDFSSEPLTGFRDLIADRQTTVVTAFGEYTLEGDMNITPFFEVNWAQRETKLNNGAPPLFPAIPALNPFNPCNPNQPNGVDCGQASAALLTNPVYNADFLASPAAVFGLNDLTYEEVCPLLGLAPADCSALNIIQPFFGTGLASGPTAIGQHIAYIEGDRNNVDVELPQTRVVVGATADLPMIDFGTVENWSAEVALGFSESTGRSVRRGIREDRLDLALGWYSPTQTPCETGLAVDPRTGRPYETLEADAAPGCVPVNLFAPSVLDPLINGQFATQAEADYLFGTREFDTDYEQSYITAYFTGDLFELPGGTVAGGFGFEYRHDELNSRPNATASRGLFFGFSTDEGAKGEKDVQEFFAEVELPLLAGVKAAEELTLNLSARYTDDEFYGGEWTESVKLGWRPVDYLLVRGTFGSSFRAPNLRELFLAGQTGFLTISDPCYIPLSAIDPATEEYDPALDERDPVLLQNCIAQGVDPTIAGSGRGDGITSYGTEIKSGGATDLFAEESESWTAGFVWEMPNNAFDLAIGATYYEIDIQNSIIEPSAGFIIGDCYFSETGNSPFCSRLTRDFTDPTDPTIDFVDAGFINRDSEGARGVDLNLTFADTITIMERPVDLTIDVRANRQLERSTLFVDTATGTFDFNEFVGEFGFPTWKGRSFIRLDYDDWRLNWETTYIGHQRQDLEGVDEFDDAITGIADTCFGPPDDVLCRDYAEAPNYFQHAVSVYYTGENWSIGGGVRNVLNAEPPQISAGEGVTVRRNTPLGYGYDVQGRRYFFNVQYNFGGF